MYANREQELVNWLTRTSLYVQIFVLPNNTFKWRDSIKYISKMNILVSVHYVGLEQDEKKKQRKESDHLIVSMAASKLNLLRTY